MKYTPTHKWLPLLQGRWGMGEGEGEGEGEREGEGEGEGEGEREGEGAKVERGRGTENMESPEELISRELRML